jgi:hypothetical protein
MTTIGAQRSDRSRSAVADNNSSLRLVEEREGAVA